MKAILGILFVCGAACGKKSETVEVKVDKGDKPVATANTTGSATPGSGATEAAVSRDAVDKVVANMHNGSPWKATIDSLVAVLGLPREKSDTQINWYWADDDKTCSYLWTVRDGDKLDGMTYERLETGAAAGSDGTLSFDECAARSKKSRKSL